MKLLPELVINKIFEQTFVIFVSNKSTYLEQNLLDQSRLIVLPNLDCHHDRYRDLGWNNETFLVDFQPQKWPKILFRLHNHHNLNQDPLMILNDPDSGKLLCHWLNLTLARITLWPQTFGTWRYGPSNTSAQHDWAHYILDLAHYGSRLFGLWLFGSWHLGPNDASAYHNLV